ncbi:Basic-leucine zipper transcription factor family protein [Melia azedarach]|uniref:Basic-leucine zipper transcription factor family protein n=1 Tax=Melia azedarach TaxID=155640 RepID=A0ACC1YTD2_MELAZ|nr:Basic-leucine zipper transcription factor family protein [Melia azedarach]
MAHLPPKIPNMTAHNWPSFPHHRMSFISNTTTSNNNVGNAATAATAMTINSHNNQPSWVDEFLDFSSVRRGAHRRSISDSIAFLDPPSFVEDCRNSNATNNMPETNGFDRLDDEQLMSMFSDDISVAVPPTASSSNPSTPSDQNSNNDEKATPLDQQQQPKNEPGEVESSCKNEPQTTQPPAASNGDTVIDPKRVKRILANRQSAQRSRVRKLQYISELERSVTTLQTEVSALSPRVAFLDHQRLILNVDNSALKQRIAALAQDKIFKDAHQEALKKEIERLRQVYHQQNLKKMNKNNNNNAAPPLASAAPPQQPMNTDAIGCTDKDRQLLS